MYRCCFSCVPCVGMHEVRAGVCFLCVFLLCFFWVLPPRCICAFLVRVHGVEVVCLGFCVCCVLL